VCVPATTQLHGKLGGRSWDLGPTTSSTQFLCSITLPPHIESRAARPCSGQQSSCLTLSTNENPLISPTIRQSLNFLFHPREHLHLQPNTKASPTPRHRRTTHTTRLHHTNPPKPTGAIIPAHDSLRLRPGRAVSIRWPRQSWPLPNPTTTKRGMCGSGRATIPLFPFTPTSASARMQTWTSHQTYRPGRRKSLMPARMSTPRTPANRLPARRQ
jgi:hypothetical protein